MAGYFCVTSIFYESSHRTKNNPLVTYYTQHSHPGIYLWTGSRQPTRRKRGTMGVSAGSCIKRSLDVERASAEKEIKQAAKTVSTWL